MEDKGPLIVALIVVAVIIEAGLLATIDNASADGTSATAYEQDNELEAVLSAYYCDTDGMLADRMTSHFICDTGTVSFDDGDGSHDPSPLSNDAAPALYAKGDVV
jgi:hypothetical protein